MSKSSGGGCMAKYFPFAWQYQRREPKMTPQEFHQRRQERRQEKQREREQRRKEQRKQQEAAQQEQEQQQEQQEQRSRGLGRLGRHFLRHRQPLNKNKDEKMERKNKQSVRPN